MEEYNKRTFSTRNEAPEEQNLHTKSDQGSPEVNNA